MLKILVFIISLSLIVIIFFHIPVESTGLASPSSAQRFLNILTGFGILLYFGLAIQINFTNLATHSLGILPYSH